MNKIKETTTNDELLNKINTYVVIKSPNGRVIAGILCESDENYSIKLGVKIIPINPTHII